MQARFLLGPAGSGKTFRCLAEIRASLKKNPEGEPLVFLAPKQATFQLERQLLVNGGISGYTRLQIFSFERLAQFVIEKLKMTLPEQLNEEGRVMVLRALLLRHENELKLFSKSARRPGFAQQLSGLLRELQQHQFTPAKLRSLAQNKSLRAGLRGKLDDLALLHENYSRRLAGHDLQDGNHLLDSATGALRDQFKVKNSKLTFEGLWLDGFAEMTPQELDLIAAIIPFCESATLAFCLDESGAGIRPASPNTGGTPDPHSNSWLSIWNVVGKSFQQCRQRIKNLPGCNIEIEALRRDPSRNRFAKNPGLAHLEKSWAQTPPEKLKTQISNLKICSCASPGAEAVFAAREILKFVRAGNRFRDCAVLVRDLGNYHKPLAREFRRYEIPFFLDRRESAAHHPLAELTRSALRTVIFDWRQNDLFAALKAGFSSADETEIDRLENAALEFGWRGKKWREPARISENPELEKSLERLRRKILPPIDNFHERLAKLKFLPNGNELAEIFRALWDDLNVERRLQNWSDKISAGSAAQRLDDSRSIHAAVFGQMNAWLDNLTLAFPREPLPLRDWLPVLEAGLANLTVGVIPPVLDEVLIGAVDRARNPGLKFALVLGVNETVFPAAPATQTILTDADRDELAVSPGASLREQLSRERFYGYIACTRAGEKLVVTFSRQNADEKNLDPSPFIAHLRQIFPALEIEELQNEIEPADALHANEIAPLLFQIQSSKFKVQNWNGLLEIPALAGLKKCLGGLREPGPAENLSPALAEKLYGPVLRSSVSRLEEFAACPFRFFVRSGLRADERKVFELDARERGSFQHDVLKMFHEQLMAGGKRWRDLDPAEARERIGKIADAQTEHFRGGLFRDSAEGVFAAHAMAESLQDFVAVIVGWMHGQYEFDPAAAELDFGCGSLAPAWEIDLDDRHKLSLHGRIDRVDLWRDKNGDAALALVLDYKSSGKKLDKVLVEHGVQLQLPAYLNVLRHWKNPREVLGVNRLVPAGVFYVNLRGEYRGGGTRAEILADADEARRKAYRHTGRFDADILDKLDRAGAADQFNYRLNSDGSLRKGSVEAMPRAEFEKLLDGVETQLREMGGQIFSGAAQVDPYRKGKQTPCEFCDYQAACRIDRWTHPYRVLRAMKETVSGIPESS
ncbi:MAG TPA: PD-(D/E)XK nuclease family protein [Verrucomicrobiae bacterium]